jgi:HK97 family phage prohead protease
MNSFNIIFPLQKDVNSNTLTGIASTTSIDKDEERMSDQALKMMVDDIKREGVNLFQDHQHGWQDTLGVIKDAKLIGNKVQVEITLDDAVTNPRVPMLLNKLNKGIRLGLSVGGNVLNRKWEYNKQLNKKIQVLDEVKIYEVSVVGIPSNSDSFLSLPMAIAKSAKLPQEQEICPLCYSEINKGVCSLCLAKI